MLINSMLFRFKSLGTQLFLYVLGGSLLGIGGLSIAFYRVLEQRATTELQETTTTQVKTIEVKLRSVEQSMRDLTAGIETLQSQGITEQAAYEAFVSNLFKERTAITTGFGFGQSPPYKIVPDRQQLWLYACIVSACPTIPDRFMTPGSPEQLLDLSGLEDYLQKDYYLNVVEQREDFWLPPYRWHDITMTTYTGPIWSNGQIIGVVGVDVSLAEFSQQLSAPVMRDAGYYMVLSAQGELLVYPPDPGKAAALTSYSDIPVLRSIWQTISSKPSGIVRADGYYWTYQKIGVTGWTLVAAVPQQVVLQPVTSLAAGGALGAAGILAAVVALFVQRLNQRFSPLVEECLHMQETFASHKSLAEMQLGFHRDELSLLEATFQQMRRQLELSFEDLETRVQERTMQLSEAKDAADRANRAKSEFLANINHELRTPLTGILGLSELLKNSAHLRTQELRKAKLIHQCGTHLLTLINDILDISKIEAAKLELELQPVPLQDLLLKICGLCQVKAQAKDLLFVEAFAEDLPEFVEVDETRLQQVLLNLLGNAIKFTREGAVYFNVRAKASEAADRVRLCFSIRDTGIGIAPEYLDLIFLPFEQLSTQEKTEGTGLGLAISKQLVALMGGELKVSSQLSQGSTFEFSIDCRLAELPELPADEMAHAVHGYEGKRQRLLVVDDRWENRAVFSNLLEPLGFAVFEAIDGEEAIKFMLSNRPDLVIVDLMMPKMSGFELISSLRRIPQFEQLPIIASSASTNLELREKALMAGCDFFLEKPVEISKLLALVSRSLHLQWSHEDLAQPDLIVPPMSLLDSLKRAAQLGQMKKMVQEAECLAASNPEYKAFALFVRYHAQQFDGDKVLETIDRSADS